MTAAARADWQTANQRHLVTAMGRVRHALEAHLGRDYTVPDHDPEALASPTALDLVVERFRLSPFERDVLVLCAGIELDGVFAQLCAEAHGDPARAYPTFGLALAALPGAHWDALTPVAPLRRWRLVEVGPGSSLVNSPLRIAERIAHLLAGVDYLDEPLAGRVDRVIAPSRLVPSQRQQAERLATVWADADPAALPVAQITGPGEADRRAVAAAVCARLDLTLYAIQVHTLPRDPADLDALRRLWEREAILGRLALLIEDDEPGAASPDEQAAQDDTVRWLAEHVWGGVFLSGRQRRRVYQRPVVSLEIARPTPEEQLSLWRTAMGDADGDLIGRALEQIVAQFDLDADSIRAASEELRLALTENDYLADLGERLWNICRRRARPHVDTLAQRLDARATWADLVLPNRQFATLRDMVIHVRQRLTVYETWGFARQSARGLGISALFAGGSGTGKTMAAEVLANELQLDLYRVDLSGVVSKYIGETEKNLARIFDAAEDGGAILLFDEADALFGKRSDVKDSHDRYANIEVGYLLQRMEAYRGLAILTTNMKSALDTAFLRRLRFMVSFPFPDAAQRALIWQGIFPPQTPINGLDVERLAQLNVAGGSIRNIALYAAFLAADAGEPVRMGHCLAAAQAEYDKLEKSLTPDEIRGWV